MLTHPTTLIIGDIHHGIEWVDNAIHRYGGACDHRVIFLGDYWDNFGDGAVQMRATCRWLKDSLAQPNRIHLIGNHDLAYFLPHHPQARCPGHSPEKQSVFDEEMAGVSLDDFKVAYRHGAWLLSHAGFASTFTGGRSADEVVHHAEEELRRAVQGQETRLLHRGPSRGGQDRAGGPIWMDWSREFQPVPGLNQIVGHSPAKGVLRGKCLTPLGVHRDYELCEPSPWPRLTELPQPGQDWSSINWCIDTKQVFVGLLEDNRFTPLVW